MASSAVASPVVMASMARVTISRRTGEPGSGNGAAASPRSCPHRDTPTRPDPSPQTDRLAGLRRLACPGLHVAGAANTVSEPHCPYVGKITSSPAVPAFHGSGLSTAARYAACGGGLDACLLALGVRRAPPPSPHIRPALVAPKARSLLRRTAAGTSPAWASPGDVDRAVVQF